MVLLAVAGAGPAEASNRGCKVPRGSTVEARSKYAVVYYYSHYRDWGCLYSLGRRLTGNDAVAGILLFLHSKIKTAVRDEFIEFFEGVFVEKKCNALAGRELFLFGRRRRNGITRTSAQTGDELARHLR